MNEPRRPVQTAVEAPSLRPVRVPCPGPAVPGLLPVLCLAPILFAAGCSSGGGGPPAAASIGAGGGLVEVTAGPLAGAKLSVPPGALGGGGVVLTIDVGVGATVSFFAYVGPAVRFGPDSVAFARAATATVPFELDVVPPLVATEDIRVLARSASASGPDDVVEIVPSGLDRTSGFATFPLIESATCWVAVKIGDPPAPIADYLPMISGSTLEFDDGSTLTLTETTTEPNLEGTPVMLMAWDDGAGSRGFYWRRNALGQTLWYGHFDRVGNIQIIATPRAATVFPAAMAVGQLSRSFFDFEWYIRFGATKPSFYGSSDLATRIESGGSITVPLGTFKDVLEVSIENDYGTGVAADHYRFWLARDIGIIRYQFGSAAAAGLIAGQVGGRKVVPQ